MHFVGADPDECAYFFEVRSQHACLGADPHQPGSMGPGGVFALILGIALVVYFAGGVFYQRTVAHERGWRQLPNHTLWYGIWEAIKVSRQACQNTRKVSMWTDNGRTLLLSGFHPAGGCSRGEVDTAECRGHRAGGGTAMTKTGLSTSSTRSGMTEIRFPFALHAYTWLRFQRFCVFIDVYRQAGAFLYGNTIHSR